MHRPTQRHLYFRFVFSQDPAIQNLKSFSIQSALFALQGLLFAIFKINLSHWEGTFTPANLLVGKRLVLCGCIILSLWWCGLLHHIFGCVCVCVYIVFASTQLHCAWHMPWQPYHYESWLMQNKLRFALNPGFAFISEMRKWFSSEIYDMRRQEGRGEMYRVLLLSKGNEK